MKHVILISRCNCMGVQLRLASVMNMASVLNIMHVGRVNHEPEEKCELWTAKRNSLWVADDVSEGVDDPVNSKFLPQQYTTNSRLFHEHAVPGLITEDGQDKEGCSVKDGLLKAEEAAMGDERLHVVMSCGAKGVSGGCSRLICKIMVQI